MAYRFLDHTADLAVELDAPTCDALFEEAAVAFTACVVDPESVAVHERREVTLTAGDRERLLVRWVEEALVAFEVDGFLVRRAEASVAGDGRWVEGAFYGESLDHQRHAVQVLVKGVSYHGLKVEQRDGGWHATLVLDI